MTAAILGATFVVVIVVGQLAPPTSNASKSAPRISPVETARADARTQAAHAATIAIKKSLRNPESVVWENIYTTEDAATICIKYRAQNGFGGMSRETVVFHTGRPSQDAETWNRLCVGDGFYDQTGLKHLIR